MECLSASKTPDIKFSPPGFQMKIQLCILFDVFLGFFFLQPPSNVEVIWLKSNESVALMWRAPIHEIDLFKSIVKTFNKN